MKKYLIIIPLFLFACSGNKKEQHAGGYVADKREIQDKTPVISSAIASEEFTAMKGGKGRGHQPHYVDTTDTDHDGIYDVYDACKTQPETYNNYQDNDGCPDTVPVIYRDTDGDGINDSLNGQKLDLCPLEKETVNGYLDLDGCPDTIIVVPPPANGTAISLITTVPNNQLSGGCGSYAAQHLAEVYHYYKTNELIDLSPAYLYSQVKISSDCGSGSSMEPNLSTLTTQGICTKSAMNLTDADCNILPNDAQKLNAADYKITGYSKIYFTDRAAIKDQIYNHHNAVMVTILADDSFVNAKAGFIWKTFSGSGNLPHTIIICGYDDSKNAYKVMGSSGTTWGDGGFGWIDYNFFETGGHTAGNGWVYIIN